MKALMKASALILIIIGAIATFSPARQLPPGIDAVIGIGIKSRVIRLADESGSLTDEHGDEYGRFTMGEETTIRFKRVSR